MRRNTARLLKYLIVAALCLTLGPVIMKLTFEDRQQQQHSDHRPVRREPAVAAHGLPVDPDELNAAVKYSPVCTVSLLYL